MGVALYKRKTVGRGFEVSAGFDAAMLQFDVPISRFMFQLIHRHRGDARRKMTLNHNVYWPFSQKSG